MTLSLEQKSLYRILFDRTGILRSVSRVLTDDEQKEFMHQVFHEVEKLTGAMDNGMLSNQDIIDSMDGLCAQFGVSFGQAQQPINVILKFHFYLTRSWDVRTKAALDCPVDRITQEHVGQRAVALGRLDKSRYLELQDQIAGKGQTRLDFDRVWDEQNLQF